MRRLMGSALVDYVLPTAIVGLILGMGLYQFADTGMLLKFISGSGKMEVLTNDNLAIVGKVNSDVDSPFNKSKPSINCLAGTCILTFGDFVLQGIPENLSTYIETTGTAGGTNKLLSIIDQIAQQYEDKGDLEAAQEFRDLANLGHFVAANQQKVEGLAEACKANADPMNCLMTSIVSNQMVATSPEVSSILTGAGPNDLYTAFLHNDLGLARGQKNVSPMWFDTAKTQNPYFAMVDKYDKIMANSKYSDSMKGVTQELYLNLNDMFYEFNNKALRAGGHLSFHDPLTGDNLGNGKCPANISDLTELTNPQTSIGSDFKSALICATGWNKDTGSSCH